MPWVAKDRILRHPARKIFENVVDGNPRVLDAGFAAANCRIYIDAVTVAHVFLPSIRPATLEISALRAHAGWAISMEDLSQFICFVRSFHFEETSFKKKGAHCHYTNAIESCFV